MQANCLLGSVEWTPSSAYELRPDALQWTDALADCQSRGARLVDINSVEENVYVMALAEGIPFIQLTTSCNYM